GGEPHFANGAAGADEPRQRIELPRGRHVHLGIVGRTRSADRWLRVTAATAVEVESRSEPLFGSWNAAGHGRDLCERIEARVEELAFLDGQARDARACASGSSSRSRIRLCEDCL